MSDEDWKAFVTADGIEDWVVLHGGPTAVFRTASFEASAGLAAAVATVPGVEGSGVIVTLTTGQVTVRLSRDLWGIQADDVDRARAISAVARERGATPDRSRVQEVQLAIAARPDDVDLHFWRAVLGYGPMAPDNAVDPLGHGSTVWMQDLDPGKPLRHAMHVDVSVARELVAARVEAALAAGGTVVDQTPQHWTLSDRAGNRVCVTAWPDGYPDPTNPQA